MRGGLCLVILVGIFATLTILSPSVVYAHPGNTDSSGCHTCRTNCPDWGLSYGEYHCHQSKGYTQPLDPIKSYYGDYGTGYTEPWPSYSDPTNYEGSNYYAPSIPSCPIFSSYNALSGSCECYSGYIVQDGECVSGDGACRDKLGYYSNYDSLSNSCKCDYGYILDSYNTCVSKDDYCEELLGFDAEYKILNDACGCRSGYILNDSQTGCISIDNYCTTNFGYAAYYDSLDKSCKCEAGYEFKSGRCQEIIIKSSAPLFIPQAVQVKTEAPPVQTTKPASVTPASIQNDSSVSKQPASPEVKQRKKNEINAEVNKTDKIQEPDSSSSEKEETKKTKREYSPTRAFFGKIKSFFSKWFRK